MAEEELMRPARVQIMLSAEELRAIDDFRFDRRMPSRAAAIRELLKRGLRAEGFETAAAGAYSGDCDRRFQPKVITDSGDRDHAVTRPTGSA